eukprot:gene20645-40482_t
MKLLDPGPDDCAGISLRQGADHSAKPQTETAFTANSFDATMSGRFKGISARRPHPMALVPFDDRDGWIWMDGEFKPWREAKVHVLTHGLHYGSSIFEGERAYDGQIFESLRHTERLFRSAEILGMKPAFNVADIEAAKAEAMAKNGFENCYIRPVMWRGSEMMGVSAQQTTIRAAVAVWEWGNYFADKMSGIRMTNAKWRRPDPKTAPCEAKAAGLYMICTDSKHAAEAEGYADALMLDWRGHV